MRIKNKQLVRRLIAKLDAGNNVSTRDMRTALGDDGVIEYESRWNAEQEKRSIFAHKPDAVRNYEAKLKEADFANARAENIKVGKRSKVDMQSNSSKQRLRNLSETLYERALEQLEADITADNDLRIWFDRDVDFTTNGTLSIDVTGMPRVVTSRSDNKLSSGLASPCRKNDIKRELLEHVLTADDYGNELTKANKLKLDGMLAKLKI